MSEVASIIFMGCCIFIPMIASVFLNKKVEVVKYIEKPVYLEKKVYVEKEPTVKTNPLISEAIQCLTTLGMKKSESKKKVEDMFKLKTYQSIESFLLDVYKK